MARVEFAAGASAGALLAALYMAHRHNLGVLEEKLVGGGCGLVWNDDCRLLI